MLSLFITTIQHLLVNSTAYQTIHTFQMKINTNHSNQNYSPNRTNLPTFQQLSQINKLPQNIRNILIHNKVLLKQNNILKEELSMKKCTIRQLKLELDKTIIEDTQDKLHYIRIIQNEVQLKTQKVLSDYYQSIANLQDNSKTHEMKVKSLENEINKEKCMNKLLAQNVVQLKQYIIQAMIQKDHIIQQLKQIIINISSQNHQKTRFAAWDNQKQSQKNHMPENFAKDEVQTKTNTNFQNRKMNIKKPHIITNTTKEFPQRHQGNYIKIEQDKINQTKKLKTNAKAKIIQNI